MQTISVRKELTDEWTERGVSKGSEFAILTDEISQAWSGMTTRQYKNHKGLTKENLRDNMSTLELVLNMLAEATTTELSKAEEPEAFDESKEIARRGGSVAGNARKEIEAQTGKPVVTSKNARDFRMLLGDVIEAAAAEVDGEAVDSGGLHAASSEKLGYGRSRGIVSLGALVVRPLRVRCEGDAHLRISIFRGADGGAAMGAALAWGRASPRALGP